MKEGLRSSTLSKRIKDKVDSSSKNCNDATTSNSDQGNKGQSLSSGDSVSIKDRAGEFEYVECGKGGINISETYTDNGSGKFGKSRRGRKRKNEGNPNTDDDAISNADGEKIGSSLVSKDSVSANDLVLSEREVEVASRMECSQEADIGLEVCVNANTNADNHKDGHELGKGHEGRNRENGESPMKCDSDINDSDKEKIKSHTISKYSDPVEDLAISSQYGEAEEGSGTMNVQCNKEAGVCEVGVSAIDERDTSNLGEPQLGRKRKKVETAEKDGIAITASDVEKIELALIPNCSDPAKDLVVSSPGRRVEDGSGTQPMECSQYVDVGVEMDANGTGDAVIEADNEKDSSNGKTPSDRAKDFIISSLEGKLEEGSWNEHVECSKDASCGDEVRVIGQGTDLDIDEYTSKLGKPPSDPAKDLVPSSPAREVEEGSRTEHIECNKDAVHVEVGVNANDHALTDSYNQTDTHKLGKPPSDPAKDLVPYSPTGEVEEGSCTEHIECNKDAGVHVEVGVNANDHALTDSYIQTDMHKLGKPRRGRKRKRPESPKKGDFAIVEVKEEKGSPLSSYCQDVKHSVGFILERKVKEEISGLEECTDADSRIHVGVSADGDANASIDADKATYKPIKGRRGRKRKKVENYKCNEVDRAGRKEVEDVKVQIIGRVLRSRTLAMSGGEKVIERGSNCNPVLGKIKNETDQEENGRAETENGESPRPIRRSRKKLKGRRGRPPKELGKNAVSEVICKKKLKETGIKKNAGPRKVGDVSNGSKFPNAWENNKASKLRSYKKPEAMKSRKNSDLPDAEDTVNGSNLAEDGKLLKVKKHNKKRDMSRSKQQQLVRDQIVSILMKAGWTIEYRPRQNKDYLDAVYVDREGKTHWSVTLAYMKLKLKVEAGVADSQTISAYTPIPEEVLSILQRVRRVKKKGGKKEKTDKEVPAKESSQNKPATKSISGSKLKNKQTSTFRAGVKTSKFKKKGHKLHHKQHQSAGASHRGKTRWNREERGSRKPMALLARSSEKGLGPDVDGFIASNGKRSLLSWMIDLGIVLPGWKVQYMNPRKTRVMLEGKITRDGIHCGCCDEILAMWDFESHSRSTQCQPFYNIYLESGISLLQCLADSWSKLVESNSIGFHFVDIDGDDRNDDTCNICGDGGDLICCDGCPSTFHQNCLDIENFPSGEWNCVYCSCKFCGTVAGNTSPRNNCNDEVFSELLTCHLCEEKFHITCIQVKDAINADSKCQSFCGRKCQEVFGKLQVLLGVKHELEEGYSWTLLKRSEVSQDISLSGAPMKVECNSKLAVAFSIMDECFLPIVDERSGTNMIHNVVYGCGSNIRRLNYSGFVTAILERGDEIISAASIRIHGNQLAEMPFIGTRHMYRLQGMCRRLLNAIELALCSLDVEKLVIPAISELLETWTSVFGFEPLEELKRQEMKCMSMVVFPGTDMLQKPLLKNRFDEGNPIPASGLKVTALGTDHQTMPEGLVNSGIGLSIGSASIDSPELIVQHACASSDETAAFESAANDTSLDNLTVAHDVTVSEGPASVSPELDGEQPSEGIDKCTNAQSGSNGTSFDHHSVAHDNKSSLVSQIGCDAMNCEGKNTQVTDEGNEAGDCEQKRERKYFENKRNSLDKGSIHHSASILSSDVHHNLDNVMVLGTLPSNKTIQDAANDPDAPSETREAKLCGSVDSKQLCEASCMINGLCKSSEIRCGVDIDDITGVKMSSCICHIGVGDNTLCMGTANNIQEAKDDLTAAQTSIHSMDGNSPEQPNSRPQVDHISATLCGTELLCNPSCSSSSCTSCNAPEAVGSCRLLKSGNAC